MEKGNLKNTCLLVGHPRTQDDVGNAGSEERNGVPLDRKESSKIIDQLGHNTVTLRCGNEPVIEALAREIGRSHQEGSQTVLEKPPVGESQSNGVIERAVGLVAGKARTLRAALEHRIGTRVPPDARILCWLVVYAAYLMNRCDIGSDGKTPLQRLHGRRDNTPILEFVNTTPQMTCFRGAKKCAQNGYREK